MADNQLGGAPKDRIVFTRKSADRIAHAVRVVEGMAPDASPLTFKQPRESAISRQVIRVCTFTGSWDINTTHTLTFQGVSATPNTASVTNRLFTIGNACDPQVAYIGKIANEWHLLNVQHHETSVMVSVTLTTAALEFTRIRAWIPYPGETSTQSIPLATETSCTS